MRTSIIITFAVAIAVACVVAVAGCGKEEVPQAINDFAYPVGDQSPLAQAVRPVLQNFMNAQYDFLVGVTDGSELSASYEKAGGAELSSKIAFLKSELARAGLSYTTYSNQIAIDKITEASNVVSVEFTDYFTLITDIPDPDKPGQFITPEGSFVYTAVLNRSRGEWVIDQFQWLGEDPWFIDLDPIVGEFEVSVPEEGLPKGVCKLPHCWAT